MAKKSDDQKVVHIKKYEPLIRPDEGDWYQVQVWRKHDPYPSFLYGTAEPSWVPQGRGASTLSGVLDEYAQAREIYAQVRIMKTTTKVINSDDF